MRNILLTAAGLYLLWRFLPKGNATAPTVPSGNTIPVTPPVVAPPADTPPIRLPGASNNIPQPQQPQQPSAPIRIPDRVSSGIDVLIDRGGTLIADVMDELLPTVPNVLFPPSVPVVNVPVSPVVVTPIADDVPVYEPPPGVPVYVPYDEPVFIPGVFEPPSGGGRLTANDTRQSTLVNRKIGSMPLVS